MTIEAPYPDLDEILEVIGSAGTRLSDIDASEGAAGNISIYIGWDLDPRRKFPLSKTTTLPIPVPELAGKSFLVTGSGRRLRDVTRDPGANLGFLRVEQGGESAILYTSPHCLFSQLTTEFNSHLAVHRDQVSQTGTNFHAVVHAQPPYLTYLSFIPRYQELDYLNRHVLRWQPELIVQLPEGIGYVPFLIPGSKELMDATVQTLRIHRLLIWAKHGVMARSDISVTKATDRIEYAETGARYEYMNLVNGEQGEGLSSKELRAICSAFSVTQNLF
jgi:rhamnulose-1-phosphate aldolase